MAYPNVLDPNQQQPAQQNFLGLDPAMMQFFGQQQGLGMQQQQQPKKGGLFDGPQGLALMALLGGVGGALVGGKTGAFAGATLLPASKFIKDQKLKRQIQVKQAEANIEVQKQAAVDRNKLFNEEYLKQRRVQAARNSEGYQKADEPTKKLADAYFNANLPEDGLAILKDVDLKNLQKNLNITEDKEKKEQAIEIINNKLSFYLSKDGKTYLEQQIGRALSKAEHQDLVNSIVHGTSTPSYQNLEQDLKEFAAIEKDRGIKNALAKENLLVSKERLTETKRSNRVKEGLSAQSNALRKESNALKRSGLAKEKDPYKNLQTKNKEYARILEKSGATQESIMQKVIDNKDLLDVDQIDQLQNLINKGNHIDAAIYLKNILNEEE